LKGDAVHRGEGKGKEKKNLLGNYIYLAINKGKAQGDKQGRKLPKRKKKEILRLLLLAL